MQLTLDELRKDNDIVDSSEGINIVYNSELASYIKGVVIDYTDNGFNRGFSIKGESSAYC